MAIPAVECAWHSERVLLSWTWLPIPINQRSEETIAYEGRAEVVEEEIARARTADRKRREDEESGPEQPRLL